MGGQSSSTDRRQALCVTVRSGKDAAISSLRRIETVLARSPWLRRRVEGHGWRQLRHRQTIAERLQHGRVTCFSGSGQHFRRFDQILQTVLGSAEEPSIKQRPSMRPICVQRMSHEDANAENDTRYRDELGHGFSPPCLTRKSSPGSLPDDFAELGKWFRRRGHS